jgi:hypothetical protein
VKIFLVFLSLLSLLHAKEETCYSVEIASVPATNNNKLLLEKQRYPKSCRVLRIDTMLCVRCECNDNYQELKQKLPQYKNITPSAYIVTSYKKRFFQTSKRSIDRRDFTDEELRLMLNSFLYSGDVANAYRVAKMGYKQYPNSLFWLQNIIKTAVWSNHPIEALKYKKELYSRIKKPKLRDDIINESLKLYQYESIENLVLEKFRQEPSKINAQLVLYLEYKIGYPQKAAEIFEKFYKKNEQRDYLLTKLLKIYIYMGDMAAAQRIVTLMERKGLYTQDNIFLIANYYYIRHDIQKAYETLLHLQNSHIKDSSYYQAVSDFGWYLNDLKNSAKASEYLINIKQGRVIDYERVIEYYKTKKKLYSAKIAKEAYLRYHKKYFFFYYA